MKKYLILLFAICSSVLSAHSPSNPQCILVKDGCIQAAPEQKVLLKDNFDLSNTTWMPAKNFKNFVVMERVMLKNKDSLRFNCPGTDPKTDSAFEIFTKPFQLNDPQNYFICFDAYANMHTGGFKGFRGNFQNRIVFYDKDNKIIEERPFSFIAGQDDFKTTVLSGKFPAGTKSFSFHLGSDSPNIRNNGKQFFALCNFKIEVFDLGEKWAKTSSFTSHAFPLTEKENTLSWQAQGKIRFQIATAPDENGFPGKFSDFFGPSGKDDTWIEHNSSILPKLPEKAKYIRYRTQMISSDSAPAVLKEVVIAGNVDKNWTNILDSTAPEIVRISESPVADGSKPVIIKISDDSGIDWSTLKLKLDNKKKTLAKIRTAEGFSIIPEKSFRRGLHTLNVSIADFNGNTAETTLFFFIGENAKNGIVSLRDDAVMLIDNEPFFPIGIYNFSKQDFNNNNLDYGLEVLKDAGFNFVCHWPTYRNPDFKEFLDAVKKHGFKTKLSSGADGGSNDADLERMAWYLAADRLNPSTIIWYIGDDTANYATPAQLRARTEVVKAIAPHLLTGQADAPFWNNKSRYRDYATATKVFFPELYPVREDTQKDKESSVACIIRDMREINKDIAAMKAAPVAVWPIIQYFNGYRTWKRFPTREELCAMSYASLIHGATGITWYTYRTTAQNGNYGVTSTPERWENMRTLALELKSMTSIFVARNSEKQVVPQIIDGPKKDAYNGDSITSMTKELNNKKYIFSVNSTLENVKAQFYIPGAKSGKYLRSGKALNINNGNFTEEFLPYEVKIFEIQ